MDSSKSSLPVPDSVNNIGVEFSSPKSSFKLRYSNVKNFYYFLIIPRSEQPRMNNRPSSHGCYTNCHSHTRCCLRGFLLFLKSHCCQFASAKGAKNIDSLAMAADTLSLHATLPGPLLLTLCANSYFTT